MTGAGHQLDDRQRVRDASEIASVIGEHVTLKPKGREYVCLCPFHDDHNPSMCVVPHKQIFHCFVCGAGGDVFTFVQRYHRMEFREALEFLAERAGIELTRRAPGASSGASGQSDRGAIIEANRFASDFFRVILAHPEHGIAARKLVERRGICPDMVEAFAVGASPDRWDGLLATLAAKGRDTRPFLDAGLLKPKDQGGVGGGAYDALRNRLIFPIHEHPTGRVIAFGARRIDDADEPKYLNSPETPVFSKSRTLYGLHQAARSIQAERLAVVVEGYTDVIACHQAGFANVVGTLGTALTVQHASVLRRLCDTVVLLFDADDAGQRAADRALEVLFNEEIDIRVASITGEVEGFKDPDELLKSEAGGAVFARVIGGATDLLEFRFARLRERLRGAGIAETSRVLTEELAKLGELGLDRVRPMRRRLILRRIAEIAGVDEGTVRDAVPGGRRAARIEQAIEPKNVLGRALGARESLLGCILAEPALWLSLHEEERLLVATDRFDSPALRAVADAVHLLTEEGRSPGLSEALAELETPEIQAAAVELERAVSLACDGVGERRHALWRDCLARLRCEDMLAPAGADAAGDENQSKEDLARLESLRRVHREVGANRRARLLAE